MFKPHLAVCLFLSIAFSIDASTSDSAASSRTAAGSMGLAAIAGSVSDDQGSRIPGVTVMLSRPGDSDSASFEVTDENGTFRIRDIRPGSYVLEALLDGFQPVSRPLTIVTGQKLDLGLKLAPAFSESLTVVADRAQTGEIAIMESRRQSAVVSDSISSEEISRTPDSNAAGVVERLTGVTVLGDKYVFVRGLGERYSGTTINGATLPTTETEKRVVPLDLFPAKLLDTVTVAKSYTPDRPGDFGSGVVEMTTTQFPSGQSLKVSLGSGYQAGSTGRRFSQYGGGLSRSGSGGQARPSNIPTQFLQRSSTLQPNGFTSAELQEIGRSLVGDWTGREVGSAAPSSDFGLTYGNTFGRLGVVLSAVSNHGFSRNEEEQRFFGFDAGQLVPINDYDLTSYKESVNNGFVGNFSARLTERNRVFLNSVFTRDASSEDRFQEGLQTSTGGQIRDYRVRYQIEDVLSTRLGGEHNLSGPGSLGSLVEWNLTRSSATNDSDLRENIYQESAPGLFTLQTAYADSGKIEYFDLEDEVRQAGLAYTTFFAQPEGSWSGSVKGGVERMERARDFAARRFRFTTTNSAQFDLRLTPDEIFTAENIRPGGFEIREFTGVNDAYDAGHDVDAGYLMTDLTRGRWRFIGGARYEQSSQFVTTFNPFDTANRVESVREDNDLLPSVNLVYALRPQTNLRFAYGRSLNRPEFRELSPFNFTEVAGGRSVSGNPDLVQATLDSFDARWETFNAGSVIAASVFYKKIDNPIERIVQPTSDYRLSFVNADSAELRGLELEFRSSLESLMPSLRLWSINANYAHISSDVTVGDHQFSVVTNTERPLEGQSDNVGNLALQFYHPRWGTMFRVLGAYSGQRLTEVGAFGLPDTYEDDFMSFDVVFSQSLEPLVPGLEIKLAGSNLLDEKRRYVQGGEIQRLFDPGRKISLSLSYTPF
ncbi:MAG TPA: TonB-dependent receptor [Thermoanaerobaculia bacterium]